MRKAYSVLSLPRGEKSVQRSLPSSTTIHTPYLHAFRIKIKGLCSVARAPYLVIQRKGRDVGLVVLQQPLGSEGGQRLAGFSVPHRRPSCADRNEPLRALIYVYICMCRCEICSEVQSKQPRGVMHVIDLFFCVVTAGWSLTQLRYSEELLLGIYMLASVDLIVTLMSEKYRNFLLRGEESVRQRATA